MEDLMYTKEPCHLDLPAFDQAGQAVSPCTRAFAPSGSGRIVVRRRRSTSRPSIGLSLRGALRSQQQPGSVCHRMEGLDLVALVGGAASRRPRGLRRLGLPYLSLPRFKFATARLLPSSVLGPVESPPCIRQRRASVPASRCPGGRIATGARQGVPTRVLAPQRRRLRFIRTHDRSVSLACASFISRRSRSGIRVRSAHHPSIRSCGSSKARANSARPRNRRQTRRNTAAAFTRCSQFPLTCAVPPE
jgi:hypothetical protein